MSLQIAIDKLKIRASHFRALKIIAIKNRSFEEAASLRDAEKELEEIIEILEHELPDRDEDS